MPAWYHTNPILNRKVARLKTHMLILQKNMFDYILRSLVWNAGQPLSPTTDDSLLQQAAERLLKFAQRTDITNVDKRSYSMFKTVCWSYLSQVEFCFQAEVTYADGSIERYPLRFVLIPEGHEQDVLASAHRKKKTGAV